MTTPADRFPNIPAGVLQSLIDGDMFDVVNGIYLAISGISGTSGYSGVVGTSGFSGYSGA